MTSNQIEYWKLQEAIRSNKAKEAETARHNVTTEGYSEYEVREGKRHNIASENLNYLGVLETQRHQAAVEGETQRHNVATEYLSSGNLNLGYANLGLGYQQLGYSYDALAEQQRHSQEVEAENVRHNVREESLKSEQNINVRRGQDLIYQSEMNRATMEYQMKQQQLYETIRSNVARESETERSNKAQENLSQQQVYVNAGRAILDSWNNSNRNMINLIQGIGTLLK